MPEGGQGRGHGEHLLVGFAATQRILVSHIVVVEALRRTAAARRFSSRARRLVGALSELAILCSRHDQAAISMCFRVRGGVA